MLIGSHSVIEDRSFKVTRLPYRPANSTTARAARPQTVGRIRTICDGVLMEASIVLSTPSAELALLTVHWFKTWPTNLQPTAAEEDAIVREWVRQEKFYRWQHETCNHHE